MGIASVLVSHDPSPAPAGRWSLARRGVSRARHGLGAERLQWLFRQTTPYPTMRWVALMNVRSHAVLEARFSPCRRSEIRLADDFIGPIPDHSVTLLDKDFWSADPLLRLADSGQRRHRRIPARKGLVVQTFEPKTPMIDRYGYGAHRDAQAYP